MYFESTVVLDQLRYTGMLDTIKIRKMGYPVRIKFPVFIERYLICVFYNETYLSSTGPTSVFRIDRCSGLCRLN
jgi:myosin heavy subunit